MNTTPLSTVLLVAATCAPSAIAQDVVHGHLINFHDNGAWSWFEDERAIVDRLSGQIVIGSCADDGGLGGSARGGDIDVAWLDISAGRFGQFELHDRLQGDDHNSPALMLRPDGRYLAMYGTHGGSSLSRWRTSTAIGDPAQWTPEASFTNPASMSYSNLHHLAETGRTYNFVRSANFDPNVMVSQDHGSTWTGTGKLLTEGGASDRPYLKYAADGRRRIHLLTTERHPRDYDNSIYHGYVEQDALHDSVGTVVDGNILDGSGQPPRALTAVFVTGTSFGGTPMDHAWTIDLAVDDDGVVRALFQTRARATTNDHRLFFARFAGGTWAVHQVCALGAGLYASEPDYTGLAALAPDRPDTLYVSTAIDPRTGAAHAKHEIYTAQTTDLGASWSFTPVTEDSSVDNLRPIVPAWDGDRTALLWLRGEYRTYTDYDLAVVGRLEAPELEFGSLTYHDATTANTTDAVGGPANPTGPSAGQGANDGRWHLRTGFGNGGTVWTASETGAEDAPMLRTRIGGSQPGTVHDVFLIFWSNPTLDWSLRAGFDPTSLRSFEKRGAAAADPNHFVTAPVLVGSTVRLYSVWLGRSRADANGMLDVFVDDFASGQDSSSRSWYDGVAIAPVACRASTQQVGDGCGGATLSAAPAPQLGATIQIAIHGSVPGAFAAVILGGGALRPMPLDPIGFPGCVLLVDGLTTVPLGTIGPGGASPGLGLTIPTTPSLRCARFGLQGATLGSALELTPATVLLPGS